MGLSTRSKRPWQLPSKGRRKRVSGRLFYSWPASWKHDARLVLGSSNWMQSEPSEGAARDVRGNGVDFGTKGAPQRWKHSGRWVENGDQEED